ncbi:GroES-like protein [Atractiella rhizophila]|nr:GroES-like protein [Atractiella rhizophila]
MSHVPEKFTGYAALTEEEGKKLSLKPWSFRPKKFEEDDVTIKVTHCSICATDVHQLTNGWKDTMPQSYPCICGHEITGVVVEAGKNTTHSIGDRVGVGYQAWSCLECSFCKSGYTQYCEKGMQETMQGVFEDGTVAQGGFADFMRTKGAFAVKLPESLTNEEAAPFFCAGVTVWSPLKRFEAGPGKKIGIIGIGGLGHLALLFSKAMGADTYALSSSDRKREDCAKLGIDEDHYINYSKHEETLASSLKSFDMILSTTPGKGMPLESLFFKLLKPFGSFVIAGLPEEKLPAVYGQAFLQGISLTGTLIGSPQMISEMLHFVAEHNIRPWTEVRDMKDIEHALKDVELGKPRYRYVLKN